MTPTSDELMAIWHTVKGDKRLATPPEYSVAKAAEAYAWWVAVVPYVLKRVAADWSDRETD